MGNRTPTQAGLDPTLEARQIDSEDGCAIFQDASGEEYEKYEVVSDGSPNFENAYAFRVANRHQQLVDVLFAGPQKSHFGCTERARYEVVTERIPYRLAHIPTLQPHNALLVLRSCLLGFRDVFGFHGLVSVKESMVGITRTNRVKVWLNSNFALNAVEPSPISLQRLDPKSHQREMVNNIFDLISSKTQQDPLWTDLMRQREVDNPNTFQEAIQLFEGFVGRKGIRLAEELRNPFNKLLHHVRYEKSFTFNDVETVAQNNGHRREAQQGIPSEQREVHVQDKTAGMGAVQFVPILPAAEHKEGENHFWREREVRMPFQEMERRLQPSISSQILIPAAQPFHPEPNPIYLPPLQQPHIVYPPNITEQRIYRRPVDSSKIRIVFNHSQPVTFSSKGSVLNSIDNGQVKALPKETNIQQSFNISTKLQEVPTFSQLPQQPLPDQTHLPPPQPLPASPPSESSHNQPSIEIEQVQPQPRPQLLEQPHYQIQVHEVTSEQSLHEELTNLIKQQSGQTPEPSGGEGRAETILSALQEDTAPPYRFTVSIEESRPSEDNIQNIEQLKTVVNASLVDTKEIKRSHPAEGGQELPARSKRSLARGVQSNSLSYREMRRLLLSATEESL